MSKAKSKVTEQDRALAEALMGSAGIKCNASIWAAVIAAYREEIEAAERKHSAMLAEAIRQALSLGDEDSDGTHIPEQEIIDLRHALDAHHRKGIT